MQFFTVKEVASILRVSAEQVLALIHYGRLRAVNVGQGSVRPRWRVSKKDLEEFTASHRTGPPPVRTRRRRPDKDVLQFYF